MKTALYIFLALLGSVFVGYLCLVHPLIILPMFGIIVLLWWVLYSVVKSAVKDALREYDKEKAEANGQK